MTDPIRVLHVEDDPAFADLTERFLERVGTDLTVTSVTTVADAQDRFLDESFDCVVSDYDLPEENGLALLRWLRQQDERFPFVLFTAKGNEEIASEAVSAGVTDYLQKAGGFEQYELLAHRIENVVSRHRTELALDQLHRINDTIREVSQGLVRANTREEIDRLVCEQLADSSPYLFAWIGDHDSDSVVIDARASAGNDTDYLDSIRITADESATGSGPVGRAVRSRETQAVQNIEVAPEFQPWREQALQRGFRSVAAVPFVHEEELYGVLAVYADRANAFDDQELAVLSELGDTVANALYAVEVRGELATSERNYREVFNKVNDAIFVHDIETGEITDVNEETCEMLGYDRPEMLELTVGDFSRGQPPYTQEGAVERIRKAAEEGPQLFEWAARRRDGTPFWMEVNLKRTVIGGQDRMLAVVRDVTERKAMAVELAESHEKIEGLLEAASRMESCETEAEIYEMAAEVAEGILAFDICGVNVARETYFDVAATSEEMAPDGTRRLKLDEGIAGQAYVSGESLLVDDVRSRPAAKPAREEYRSTITVPIGEVGVFQAVATEVGFFTQDDLELAELLVSHVKEAVERVRSRQALEASEEMFRELFHNANDAIFLVDVTDSERMTLVEVNDIACERLGYARDELLSMDPVDFHREEEFPDREEEFFDRGKITFETVHLTSDGAEIPVEINAHQFEFDGEAHVLAIARDISDRREREEILGSLHEATRGLIRADDAEEIASIAVEAAKNTLDIPLAAVLGYDEECETLAPIAVTEELTELFGGRKRLTFERSEGAPWRAFDSGQIQRYDTPSERKDFRVLPVGVGSALDLPLGCHGVFLIGSETAHSFDDADIEFAEILAANTEVALDRAAREHLLREQEAKLRAQRDQFEALFENVPDPAVSTSFDGGVPIVQRVNSAFEEVFGSDAEAIVGKNLDDHIVPSNPTEDPVRLNQQSTDGKVVRKEIKRKAVDGVRDFLLHGVPINVGEPNSRAFGIYTDITEQKQREAELARQNEQLDEFAAIVSHDLRNPLNVAQGYLELARKEGDDEYFQKVAAAHDRVDRLIQGVLTLAREGKTVGELERVDLASVVEMAWSHVETVDATLSIADNLDTALADEDRLFRLLENLFRNAIEHGGPTVTVTVGPTATGFFVADDGPGIPEGEHEDVFEYGFTTQEDGTGFGLAIVQRIVDGHGWTIDATEAKGGGTRFEIST